MGLLPIMLLGGTGSDVMQRIAAPLIGGMVTTTLLSLLVLPVVYSLATQFSERRSGLINPAYTEHAELP